jgi:parvulin-like peptidyl-prolyl isomerase
MLIVPALLFSVLLMGQKPKTPAAAPKPPSPKVINLPSSVAARVNEIDITADDIKAYLVTTGGRKVLQEIVQKVIVEREAKKLGVSVSAGELSKTVKEEKAKVVSQMAQQSGEVMTFEDITRKFGLTENEVEQTVRMNLLARKAFSKKLETEIPGLDGQVKLAHVLLATVPLAPGPDEKPPTPEEQKKKDEEQKARADQILSDIKAGLIKFEDAAKQFSDDKGSAEKNGDLPYAGKGVYVPEFEKAAFALKKPGDLTAPIKSQFGWHIIKLVQRGSEAPAAEKTKYKQEKINEVLAQQGQLQNWLMSLSRGASIVYNPKAKFFPKN